MTAVIAVVLTVVLAAVALYAVHVATLEPAGRHVRTVPVPAPRRPVNGQYRGTQPRLTRPGPFTAVDMPAVPEPEPGPAWGDPGDGLGPDVPIVRPWSPEIAYGADRCQLDVAEAERRFALAMGPDGCEQT
jgi:hypothetical protein